MLYARQIAVKRTGRRAIFGLIWDKLGIIVSGLCLLDCLFLPLFSAVLVSLESSGWLAILRAYLLPIVGVTASLAFYHSLAAHRSYGIVAMGAAGFILLVLGEVFESQLRFLLFNWVTLSGSGLLIVAHLRNLLLHSGHRHVQRRAHAHSAQVP